MKLRLVPRGQWGWCGLAPPSAGVGLPPGMGRVPTGHLSPCSFSPSPQSGEGTPHVTGFFEVMVAGKLVHSKKVCVTPSFGARRGQGPGTGWVSWAQLTPSLFLPSPERRWLRGHGKQVSEAGNRHQSRFSSGLRCPESRGEGCSALEVWSWLLVLMPTRPECSFHPVHSRTSGRAHLMGLPVSTS